MCGGKFYYQIGYVFGIVFVIVCVQYVFVLVIGCMFDLIIMGGFIDGNFVVFDGFGYFQGVFLNQLFQQWYVVEIFVGGIGYGFENFILRDVFVGGVGYEVGGDCGG